MQLPTGPTLPVSPLKSPTTKFCPISPFLSFSVPNSIVFSVHAPNAACKLGIGFFSLCLTPIVQI
ncbi:hypothetical protein QUC31_017000 [Theobroma cacao]